MAPRQRLANGRTSGGYVPMEIEAVDSSVSAEALGLLLRLRRDSMLRGGDGMVEPRAVEAVATYSAIPAPRLARCLQELRDARLLRALPEQGVQDVNYATWCRTQAEQEAIRADWRRRKQQSRQAGGVQMDLPVTSMSQRDIPRDSSRDSPRDSPRDSTQDTSGNHADVTAMSPDIRVRVSRETSRDLRSPSSENEYDPREAVADELVASVAQFVSAGTLSAADERRVRRWPYAFPHLAETATAVLAVCDDVAGRSSAPDSVRYFEPALGEADAAAADQRGPAGRRHAAGLHRASDILADSTANAQPVRSEE